MKIRLGFVSNSSTTSFIVYGVAIDANNLVSLLKKEALPSGLKWDEEENPVDTAESILDTLKLPYCYGQDTMIYIGKSPEHCPDDQAMGAYKACIRASIGEFLNVPESDFGFHSETWYDG